MELSCEPQCFAKGSPQEAAEQRARWAARPGPPNVPLLRALCSLLDDIWGVLKGN